jgi:hypothetical protein
MNFAKLPVEGSRPSRIKSLAVWGLGRVSNGCCAACDSSAVGGGDEAPGHVEERDRRGVLRPDQ